MDALIHFGANLLVVCLFIGMGIAILKSFVR
jgi:hypothetical protein